jgi:hypothetical protein
MPTIQLASRPWIDAVIIVIAYLSLPVLALSTRGERQAQTDPLALLLSMPFLPFFFRARSS